MTTSYWADKSAVVTGGSRGQGASAALMLLDSGARVYVMDCMPEDDASWSTLRERAAGLPGELVCRSLDVAKPEAWQLVAKEIGASDRSLFGLVNNAGITGPRNTVTRTKLEDWRRVLDVNLDGSFLGIKFLAPLMKPGSSIVNISSTSGLTGYFSAAYSTSKWALRGLTKSAAMELAPLGIRVNCVCPGVVDTDMIRSNAMLFEALKSIIPMSKMATPDQIAEVVCFLLGPNASYVTGTDIPVDGGVTSGGLYWPVAKAVGAL